MCHWPATHRFWPPTSCVNGIPVPGIKAGSAVPCRTSVLSHKQLARVWDTKPPTQPPKLPPTKRSPDDPAQFGYSRFACFASSEVTASCNNRHLRISMPRRRHLDKTSPKRSVHKRMTEDRTVNGMKSENLNTFSQMGVFALLIPRPSCQLF